MRLLMRAALCGLTCLAFLVLSAPAKALMIAPNPIPLRVATADLVVVGKVTGFGDRLVPAERFKGDMGQYQIATVQVEDTLVGAGVKQVKVAFIPPAEAPAPVAGGGGGIVVRPIRPGIRGGITLAAGQEAALFLTKHPTKDFYTVGMYFDVINKKDNPGFGEELAQIKQAAKLLANAKAGLASKDAEESFQTAAMLITRYRTPKVNAGEAPKQVPIDAAESKLILEALAKADWEAAARKPGAFGMNPQQMFFRLGITPADGWTQPKNFKEFPAEAKKWLEANSGKFKVQKFVAAEVKAEDPPADR